MAAKFESAVTQVMHRLFAVLFSQADAAIFRLCLDKIFNFVSSHLIPGGASQVPACRGLLVWRVCVPCFAAS